MMNEEDETAGASVVSFAASTPTEPLVNAVNVLLSEQ
jgi:hypothetical protein